MKDYLVKALAFDGKVRAYTVVTTNLVNEMQKKHNTSPTASAALGRAVSIGALMGSMLKDEEKLTIQVKGDGPLGQIIIDANSKGTVRGYVENPDVDLPLNQFGKLNVAEAVGKGNIYVIKDLGLKEPYRGSVPIVSGELGEDFTYYFVHSEQIPSAVGAGVLVNTDYSIKASGGFIIQVMPGLKEEEIDWLENTINEIPPISQLIEFGLSPEEILERIFQDNVQILETIDQKFNCNCSRDRIENLLIGLGKEEIKDMIEKQGEAEIICQFCRTKYQYSKGDLEKILEKLN